MKQIRNFFALRKQQAVLAGNCPVIDGKNDIYDTTHPDGYAAGDDTAPSLTQKR